VPSVVEIVWWFDFTTTCAISAYHHESCEFEPRSWEGVFDTTLCDKVYQWLATGRWFSPGTPVSSTNKTDHHDIAEILLKVALNTISPNPKKHDNELARKKYLFKTSKLKFALKHCFSVIQSQIKHVWFIFLFLVFLSGHNWVLQNSHM
jgi:hypothetical protein